MKSKKIWVFVNWGILLVAILAVVWVIWGFPQGDNADTDVPIPVEKCIDVEGIENIGYEACYDLASEMLFLKMDREHVNYQINKATVSFVGLVSHSYDFAEIPLAGESNAYKFSSRKNPGGIHIELDVVRSNSELFCDGKSVFVDYCPTGASSGGIFIGPAGVTDLGDFVEVGDFPDVDSGVIFLSLADKEKLWESLCKSSWDCGDWDACEDGIQRRDCRDVGECIVSTGSPVRVQRCDVACVEDWECDWSSCENGFSVPQCNDLNQCGTSYDIPNELLCEEKGECVPDVVCGDWTDCSVEYSLLDVTDPASVSQLTGSKSRLCVDSEGCASPAKEEKACSVSTDIYTKKFEKCGEEYIGIYDVLTGGVLAILKEGAENTPYLNIYFNDQESVYCDYCFDGVMNGDEEKIDCGGSCRDCQAEVYYEEGHWWDFLF